jgi:hypothetical protein
VSRPDDTTNEINQAAAQNAKENKITSHIIYNGIVSMKPF